MESLVDLDCAQAKGDGDAKHSGKHAEKEVGGRIYCFFAQLFAQFFCDAN